uniref:Uncharacterized protein n=1 Tax=Thermogemmatispora argillosa TaxID=2045280 RepID=A0A455T2L3_9CHLR|nr:hypothetical protein KTA_23570 [Thermogemmatispora argillosa]
MEAGPPILRILAIRLLILALPMAEAPSGQATGPLATQPIRAIQSGHTGRAILPPGIPAIPLPRHARVIITRWR